MDLDRSPDLREDWFVEIEKQGFAIEDELKSHVFFWIQEMEAWFLKQTSAIEEWAQAEGFIRNKGIVCDISQLPEIKDKDIERLQHKPSLVLYNLLKKTYYMDINGEKKSIKYGKLRHAPDLLSHLDILELLAKDNEFRTFLTYFQEA